MLPQRRLLLIASDPRFSGRCYKLDMALVVEVSLIYYYLRLW